jgi:hypothetical protein
VTAQDDQVGRLRICHRCGWKVPNRPGCTNPKCSLYQEVVPSVWETHAPWPALGVLALGIVIVVRLVTGLGGNEACERWTRDLAEQVTILQMADDSLDFIEAEILAEQIVGPPPVNCP